MNIFVGIVQSFQKIPALHALAPRQTEPPFFVTQLAFLGFFVALTIAGIIRFRPKPLGLASPAAPGRSGAR